MDPSDTPLQNPHHREIFCPETACLFRESSRSKWRERTIEGKPRAAVVTDFDLERLRHAICGQSETSSFFSGF
jgi:hypothetical protein